MSPEGIGTGTGHHGAVSQVPDSEQRAAPSRVSARAVWYVVGGGTAYALLLAGSQYTGLSTPCLFRTITGLDCPFCGGTRAGMSLLRGDVATAADYNLLVTIVAFVLAAALVWEAAVRALGRPTLGMGGVTAAVRPRVLVIASLAVIGVFWVVRNLPFLPYLATAT